MLDIKLIRNNPTAVKDKLARRGVSSRLIDQLLQADKKWRQLVVKIERARQQQKQLSKSVSQANIKNAKSLKEQIKTWQKQMIEEEKKRDEILNRLPNLPSDKAPQGKDESDNKVLRQVGRPPQFNFRPKSHLEIGEQLDIIDVKRAAKVSGSRFAYLKGLAVQLEFALINYAFDLLIKEGFIPVIPPVMIKEKPYKGMGRLADDQKEERYYLPKDDLYLVGSAEHSIGPMHMDEVLNEKELPKRYVGFSTCFRREAGSYGKDTKGIIRVHQFDKVEMFSFTKPEESDKELEYLVSLQEKLMQGLKLPYQVVEICTGDLGWTDARQFDIETWLPSENKYKETHSASNTTDFQARGVNVRYHSSRTNKLEFVHMLNATGLAIGRTIAVILENFQTKDGKIKLPPILKKGGWL